MQVLNSARDSYTMNHYFSMHILFTTISLLQKQRLNPRNYSKREIIMTLFVWATGKDMNMHAKFQIICKHRYLWTINLVSEFLQFFTKIYRAIWSSPLWRAVQEDSHKTYFANFGHSYKFLWIFEVWNDFWNLKQLEKRLNPRVTPTFYKN
jgi:hypothetical protein